ncbi:TolC family protein [Phenylobacterium sp.]|jgi:outer membrane protein TolC|uniref:TolC family protein n=1 Tax=Phenylobacterium sp. TaxID=1871053 RepID=UPI0035B25DD1
MAASRSWIGRLAVAAFVAAPLAANAQDISGSPLDFAEAQARLLQRSQSLAAAKAGLQASQDHADAVRLLGTPSVFLDAQLLRYRKTIDVSLDPAKMLVQSSVDGFLASLPNLLPGAPSGVVDQIGATLGQGVSGALTGLPGSARLQTDDTLFRPTVAAVAPLYAGGAITAAKDAAKASVRQAQAELSISADVAMVRLVQAYYGQQLAAQVLKVSKENRDGFERHYQDALKFEHEGFLSKAQRLQVQVARDAALRQYERAASDYETAQTILSQLLSETGPVAPTSPLFVGSTPLEPAQTFVDAALAEQPELRKLDALRDQAAQGVKVAQAALKPKVFGFAEYNLNRDEALLIEPDWIVGVGVHYALLAGLDRGKAVSAARQRELQAVHAAKAARDALQTTTLRAHRQVETARRQYALLAVNIEAARENLRLQELAFREGQANPAEVIDARVALSVAETQRAAAAYEYDLALAELLTASGRMQSYGDYAARAEKVSP